MPHTKETQPLPKASWCWDLIGLTLISLVFFALFLGSSPLRLPDEGRYAEVAREMFAHLNFITPTLNSVVFFDKPPLYYWLSAVAMSIGGVNEWTARAAPAFFGMLGVLGIYITGRLIDNRRTGWIAAGILATTPLYFLISHFANCDLIVAVCISLSLWSFLITLVRPELSIRRWAMGSAYVWCALAMLAKGLIGIVFPAAIIGLYILIFNRWSLIKRMYLIPGLILVLAIVLPWFILVSKNNADFLHYFFYIQQYQRFISHSFNDKESFWFYIPIVLLGMWPWTLWLMQSIIQPISHRLTLAAKDRTIHVFLLLWAAVILVFFSIPTSKTIGYIVPIFPPLALMLARYISSIPVNSPQRRLTLLNLIIIFIAALLLIIAPFVIYKLPLTIALSMSLGFGLLILSILGYYALHRNCRFYHIIIVINAILLISTMALAYLGGTSSAKAAAIWIKNQHIPIHQIYVYNKYPFDLPFYLQNPIHIVLPNWQEANLATEDSWRGEFAYALQQAPRANPNFVNQADFIQQWQSGQPMYIIITAKQVDDLQTTLGTKIVNRLSINHKWRLVTNQAVHVGTDLVPAQPERPQGGPLQ